jgi:metallo-beta-lactamase family protein
MFKVTFIGATETVTGSCYLIETDTTKFIVDCGMYQGPEAEYRNMEAFPFNPNEVDFMLLTHAHLDHVGLIPKLVRHGFNGPIYATLHSAQIGEIIMRDSAKIQENNYSEGIAWKFTGKVALIYNTHDAENAVEQFRVVNPGEEFVPADGITIKPVTAGHILGAVSFEIEYQGKVVVFSGDIGRFNQDLIEGFSHEYKREVDYVVMEALYGGKIHPARHESVGEMMGIIRETLERGGSAYVPCFAVQRTQEILNDLKIAKSSGALADDVPVWLDTPMGQKVTRIYSSALDHTEDSKFNFPGLNYIQKHKKSEAISKLKGQIVISGSGMAEGGRILNHIRANISNPLNSFIFVGYQAEQTLGRALVEGAKNIMLDGMPLEVKAKIVHLQGFSAHGDANDYETWVKRYDTEKLKRIFFVHCEFDAARDLKKQFEDKKLDHPYIPRRAEVVELF